MTIFESITVSLISSSVILSIFTFIVKKYIGKWISIEFDKKSRINKLTIDQKFKVSDFLLENQLGIYPEILELIYRLRNMLIKSKEFDMAYKWDPDLRVLGAHLTENMYKYRIFLSDEIFDNLHKFKHIVQDAIVFHDIYTRKENLFDRDGYSKAVLNFHERIDEADKLYKIITSNIRNTIDVNIG